MSASRTASTSTPAHGQKRPRTSARERPSAFAAAQVLAEQHGDGDRPGDVQVDAGDEQEDARDGDQPSPISTETQSTESKRRSAEAQRGVRIDRAPEVGVGDEPVGRGGRERGRDQR